MQAQKFLTAMEDEGRRFVSSEFGTLLRRYRLAAGLSQEALAERARVSTDGVSALERGYRRTPRRDTVALLASALALNQEQRTAFEAAATRSGTLRRRGMASVTIGPWADSNVSILPLALSSFVGREIELEEITTLVRKHRLVTLTGAGGVGKTQTALRVATAPTHADDSAIRFVELAPIADPSFVIAAIASTLDVQEVPDRPLLETLLVYLKNKALLLILDNCEHVINEAAIVANAILARCPRVKILATSRESLRVSGEYAYRVPSLSVPTAEAARRLRPSHAAAYGAIVLFADRARAADHRFILSDENTPTVAEICRLLDGIPLAVELAAARVNVLPVKTLLKRLDDRLPLLDTGQRTAPHRQQTMRAMIDWSYDLLVEKEQRLFERLSIFAGGCTLAAATAVCAGREAAEDEVLNLLSSLVDKSMVATDFEEGEPRYRLLESFRRYAQERLAVRGEQEIVSQRHGLACLQLAERLESAYDAGPDEVWWALAQEELDNWRAALQWALTDRGDVTLGQQLVGRLSVVWSWFATIEGRRWLLSALALVDERTPIAVLAGLDYAEAIIAHRLREYKVELARSESAIARYCVVGDSLGMARAQSIAGHALECLGHLKEANAVLQAALTTARGLGNRQLVATTLRMIAFASALGGDVIAARGYLDEALTICDAMDAKINAAEALEDLAYTEFRAGNTELALARAIDALSAYHAFNDLRTSAVVLSCISEYLIALDRYDEAEERAREALNLARERHEKVVVTWALQHLGAIAALRPQPIAERAFADHARAARILGFVGARRTAIAQPRLWEQEYDRAIAPLCDAIGAQTVANLLAVGAAMTEEQAVEEASH